MVEEIESMLVVVGSSESLSGSLLLLVASELLLLFELGSLS